MINHEVRSAVRYSASLIRDELHPAKGGRGLSLESILTCFDLGRGIGICRNDCRTTSVKYRTLSLVIG